MKRISWLVWLLVLGFSNTAYSQTTPAANPAKKKTAKKAVIAQEVEASAPENFDPENLKGKWAMGGAYLYGIGNLTFRDWIENNSALDLYLGGYFSSLSGTDFNGNPVTTPYCSYDVGIGLRQVVARPVENVKVEFIQRLMFVGNYNEFSNTYDDSVQSSQRFNLYLGIGFEAFIPFWKNLSIEGDAGLEVRLNFDQNRTDYFNGSSTYYSYYTATFLTANNDQGLFNIAAHYYF
jgi:hypothetical protein